MKKGLILFEILKCAKKTQLFMKVAPANSQV